MAFVVVFEAARVLLHGSCARHQNLMHYIGTAGWSVPPNAAESGTRLQRYSSKLSCVEVNSTFYRAHRSTTWRKWAAETPDFFRFSIKAPRSITHDAKLHGVQNLLVDFLSQIEPLGEKTGPLLFQLPPSLRFDAALAEDFLALFGSLYKKEIALEPRHGSWFTSEADALLETHRIARVAADPPKGASQAANSGGDFSLAYYRLHGSPRTYYSNYNEDFLRPLASKTRALQNAWIIFDNTALGHAFTNALQLKDFMRQ
jgi:uncharacterized protein YecE (DUF72 family)